MALTPLQTASLKDIRAVRQGIGAVISELNDVSADKSLAAQFTLAASNYAIAEALIVAQDKE
jgi:hypothetical protein